MTALRITRDQVRDALHALIAEQVARDRERDWGFEPAEWFPTFLPLEVLERVLGHKPEEFDVATQARLLRATARHLQALVRAGEMRERRAYGLRVGAAIPSAPRSRSSPARGGEDFTSSGLTNTRVPVKLLDMNTALIASTTSRVNDDQAVNVTNRFWLLRDAENGRIDVFEVDESNTYDDITVGALDTANLTVEQAIERVAASVTLDDSMRAEILVLLTRTGDIASVVVTCEADELAAIREELQLLAPAAHAIVTDTADRPVLLVHYDEPMTAHAALDYLA